MLLGPLSHSYYSQMTMEVILATAFGRSLDVQNGKGGELYESLKFFFTCFRTRGGLLSKLAFLVTSK